MSFALRASVHASVGSGGTTLTVGVPSGTVNNDLMLLLLGEDFTSSVITLAGWTNRSSIGIPTGTGRQGISLRSRIASSEPGSYTPSFSGSSTNKVGIMVSWGGVDPVTPFDVQATGTNSSNSTSLVAPSINTTNPGALVVAMYGYKNNSAFTVPAGMTLVDTIAISTVYTIALCSMIQSASGTSGTKTGTIATTSTSVFGLSSYNPQTAPPTFWQDFIQSFETNA